MSTNDSTHEYVSVTEAATRLKISPTTVRERIRTGQLEAERINRPQGTVFMVKLPVDERPIFVVPESTPEDVQARTDGSPSTHGDERAGAELINAAVAPLVERLAVADRQLAERDAKISDQAQTIASLREERGTLAERAEQERERTEDARIRATQTEQERDAVRGELEAARDARVAAETRYAEILAAQAEPASAEAPTPFWRAWWLWLVFLVAVGAGVLLGWGTWG